MAATLNWSARKKFWLTLGATLLCPIWLPFACIYVIGLGLYVITHELLWGEEQ